MGKLAGQTVSIWWILSPQDEHLKNHPELDNMLSVAYNLRMAAKSYADMPFFRWAWACDHTLALYRRFHYPHQLESSSIYAI